MKTWLIISLTALIVTIIDVLVFAYLPEIVDFIFKIFNIKDDEELNRQMNK